MSENQLASSNQTFLVVTISWYVVLAKTYICCSFALKFVQMFPTIFKLGKVCNLIQGSGALHFVGHR